MEKSPESSPEFEFWMVGNPPSFPQHNDLLTADELFADGVLLPIPLHPLPDPNTNSDSPPVTDPSPPPPPPHFPSKKWKHIFRPGDKKRAETKERKGGAAGSVGSATELNIHIWPFSRSRSAGNSGASSSTRPRVAVTLGRKASSAPCSRSNSRGESSKPAAIAERKWGPHPTRFGLTGGIHLGRSIPVWKFRRTSKGAESNGSTGTGKKVGGGVGMLNLNVNTCIGYGNQVSCRGDDKDGVTDGDGTGGESGDGGGSASHFNLRTIFSKKVY